MTEALQSPPKILKQYQVFGLELLLKIGFQFFYIVLIIASDDNVIRKHMGELFEPIIVYENTRSHFASDQIEQPLLRSSQTQHLETPLIQKDGEKMVVDSGGMVMVLVVVEYQG